MSFSSLQTDSPPRDSSEPVTGSVGLSVESSESEKIRELREWIETVPFLPHDLSDDMLKQFIMGSPDRDTKELLSNYFRVRQFSNRVFRNRHPGHPSNKTYPAIVAIPMPSADDDDIILFWAYLSTIEETDFGPQQLSKQIFIELDIMLQENRINGKTIVMVWDMEKFTVKHLRKVSRKLSVSTDRMFHEAFPAKIGPIYILHAPPCMLKFADTFPTFEFRIVESIQELFRFIPDRLIPSDMGGTLKLKTQTDLLEDFTKRRFAYGEWLADQETLREKELRIRLCIEEEATKAGVGIDGKSPKKSKDKIKKTLKKKK